VVSDLFERVCVPVSVTVVDIGAKAPVNNVLDAGLLHVALPLESDCNKYDAPGLAVYCKPVLTIGETSVLLLSD